MRRRLSPGLTVIDPRAMRKAIAEFNEQGRARFLKRFGVSRSSKFYLIYGQRLYDTKALVSAAYFHATRKRLRNTAFSGGGQTESVFRRLAKEDTAFQRTFEDTLGELRNLSSEYDRIPRAWTDLRELGFSQWIPLLRYEDLNTGWLPGIYVIADSNRQPRRIPIIDRRVVYIGETVEQDICKRLYQFDRAIRGLRGHSGGTTLRRKKYMRKHLWLSIRSFPLAYGLGQRFAKSLRSAQIRHLERTLLYEYVRAIGAYPPGNSK